MAGMLGTLKILLPKFERIKAIGLEIPKWTDPNGLYFKLPEHYKRRQREFLNTFPKAVHYKPAEKHWEVDHETGNRYVILYYFYLSLKYMKFDQVKPISIIYLRKMIRDTPIVILYPKQAKMGLWGGEGVIPGYKRPVMTGFKRPQYL